MRLQVAFSLGEAPAAARDAGLALLARNDTNTLHVLPAVVSSLTGGELAFLERLIAAPERRDARPGGSTTSGGDSTGRSPERW